MYYIYLLIADLQTDHWCHSGTSVQKSDSEQLDVREKVLLMEALAAHSQVPLTLTFIVDLDLYW